MPIEIFARTRDGTIASTAVAAGVDVRCSDAKVPAFRLNNSWGRGVSTAQIGEELQCRARKSACRQIYWVAFGYTGSGKTYTIYGLLDWLIRGLAEGPPHVGRTRVSAYQTYGGGVYDMLSRNHKLRVYRASELVVEGLERLDVVSGPPEVGFTVEHLMEELRRNRAQASTNMNAVSSRSHAVIEVTCGRSRYTLVDMAGQESGRSAAANDAYARQEGVGINLDMLALKECIRARQAGRAHVPFRSCLLTMALKPMFSDTCYTAFMCTVALSHPSHFRNDSLAYAAALYNGAEAARVGRAGSQNRVLFQHYTNYLDRMGCLAIKERKSWATMKDGDFRQKGDVQEYIRQRVELTKQFERALHIASAQAGPARPRAQGCPRHAPRRWGRDRI